MAIPTYAFYTGTYHGISVPEDDWERIAMRADEEINHFERVYTVTDPTEDGSGRQKAVCAIADQLYTYEVIASNELSVDTTGSLIATSVSIGSVSTSAKSPNVSALGLDMSEAGQKRAFYALLQKYLDVYRGVGRCR